MEILVAQNSILSDIDALKDRNKRAATWPRRDVNLLFQNYWDWRMKDRPQLASHVGIQKYDTKLNDHSEDAYERRYYKIMDFLDEIEQIEPNLSNPTDIANLRGLKHELLVYKNGYKFKGFYMSINSIQGVHENLESIFDWMPKETYQDFQNILTRMEEIPRQIFQIIALMKRGVKEGITYHRVSVEKLPEALKRHIVNNLEDSPFYAPFKSGFLPSFSREVRKLQDRAKEIIKKIVDAYDQLRVYLVNDYLTRADIAISSIKNGHDYYQQCIRYHTSTNLTAEEIHQIGISEVNRILIDIKNIVSELGYDMSVKEFSNHITVNPQNYFTTPDDLLSSCENILFHRIKPKLDMLFNKIPKSPIEIRGNPLPTAGTAYHENPSLDGLRPGYFVIVTHDPKTWPKYSLLSLTLHEANPGHHLQSSHVIEDPAVPLFRKLSGAGVFYGACPSEFPSYSYYLEGWALYAEKLGFDMDLYTDPMERFGYFSQEIFRACRLVVDTGIHALGWSRERAIKYMLDHIAFTRRFVENQIDRYVTWPGQALSYKMGELRMMKMRNSAEELLGDRFNIKDFHQVILDNFGSLDDVEDQVTNWVDRILKNEL